MNYFLDRFSCFFTTSAPPWLYTLSLHDALPIFYRVTIPAGTLRQLRPGRLVWNAATGSIGGIRSLRLRQRGRRSVFFRLRTVPLGLSAADRVDHFIEVSLRAGTAAVTTTPLWHFDGTSLVAKD